MAVQYSYEVFRRFHFHYGVLYVAGGAPILLSCNEDNAVMRDEIIENYFSLGLTAPEIALFLVSVHGIGISLRQLKRILRRLGCTRRWRRSNLNEVVEAVEEELRGSGSLLGYRKCINQHGLITTREVVRHVLRVLILKG